MRRAAKYYIFSTVESPLIIGLFALCPQLASSEEQKLEGYSIRGQTEKLKSYVSAKSWAIYNVYLDEGISGKNITDPTKVSYKTVQNTVNKMLEHGKAHKLRRVYAQPQSCLPRQAAH